MIPVVAFCAAFALWFMMYTADFTVTLRRKYGEPNPMPVQIVTTPPRKRRR